jgi:hypothetical protein
MSEQASEGASAPTDRRSGAIARLLSDGWRSPEGERAVVEQSRCDTLSHEPEMVNPRVGTSEPRVPFLDSDEVGSSDGPGKSRGHFFSYARVSKIWGSFHFSLDPIFIDSNPNYFLLFMRQEL